LYRNDGDWRFTEVTGEAGLGDIRETYHGSWGDYDNDGDLDLTTKGRLYRSSGATGHWLKVRLVGNARRDLPESGAVNRAAIGAQVRIQLGTRTLTRQVESATGRGNMNEQTLHFGLGSRLDPVDLKITWPDGFLQLVDGVEVDQMLTVGYRMKAPVLRSITAKPFGFRFDTEPNRTYSIEGSEDLKAWEVLEQFKSTKRSHQFSDPGQEKFQQQYYRAKVVE
ncbi:uncharacterized protein METZ01_LOCUS430599, partial [marine metagenome]